MPELRRKLSILVPALPWEADRSELSVSSRAGDAARENLPTGAAQTQDIRAWEEARKHAAISNALRQAEQDR